MWNECVKSFHSWDIYYLYEYAYSFMLHGDGEILLIYFENNQDRFCYVVMQNDISSHAFFSGVLEKELFYDWETPYGYGGPLCDAPLSNYSKEVFQYEIRAYCREHNIVSQFVRFHPLLENYKVIPEIIETRFLRDTIYMDTSVSTEMIMKNMDSKNRNMVRKGIKNGVTIVCKPIEEIGDFIPMYNDTMKHNNAEEYYTFQQNYFDSLRDMRENACVFYAVYEMKVISGAIIFFNDKYAHYHLSGSDFAYRQYAPSNLLLYEVACWAQERGIEKFHLGGGMSSDDSLFGFKKQFNKNGRAPFVVGRTIFLQDVYETLLDIRESVDDKFDRNNRFMIQYRR